MTRQLQELFELVGRLADPARRLEVARALAAGLGADDLIVFVPDERVRLLLPAPGFPQTLPEARRWRAFLAGLEHGTPRDGPLPHPGGGGPSDVPAVGMLASDGSALVLLGGRPAADLAGAVLPLVPALAAAFRGEQALAVAEGHAAVARETAGQAAMLTAALEGARKALQEALARAEAANAAKDHFLAVLSHELRTPLAPVLTTAGALLEDRRLPDDVRESLEVIRRNAELEARLIDDLLDMTRIARGKMRLRFETVDVHDLVGHTVEICRSDVYRKNLTVVVDRLDAGARHVRADPARLQQVLWNLLKNAVKFTPAGGRVEVRTRDGEGGRIVVEVSDTGIGIDPRHLATIFDAFEQSGDDVTRRFGGLGLGLAISRAIVEAHAGELTARSDGPGKGATFRLTLPVTAAPPPAVAGLGTTAGADGNDGGPGRGRGLRLLLVEDHADTAKVMARLLTNLGHAVTTAHTMAGALALPRGGQQFDLVLSDLGLPDGSGFDLMGRLRREHGLQGIAISGYGMEEDVARAEQAGFVAHLTKPVDFRKIQAALNQYAATHTPPDPGVPDA